MTWYVPAVSVGASALVVACAGGLLAAEPSAPQPVFTTQQATTGKAAYAKACAVCHMADLSGNNDIPPLAGKDFLETWGNRTTKEFIDYMAAAMPPGGPPLNAETYLAITAYVLHINGAVAGTQPLVSSTNASIASLTASHDEGSTSASDAGGASSPEPAN